MSSGADGETSGRQTAMCPHCWIDSVTGFDPDFRPTPESLKSMHEHWFVMRLNQYRSLFSNYMKYGLLLVGMLVVLTAGCGHSDTLTDSTLDTPKVTTKDEAEHATRHCFVLCRATEPGDLSRAAEVAAQIFGQQYSAEVGDDNIITVTHGEDAVGFLAHVPAPIPGGEAEDNADGNFLWPNGKDEAAKHRSHVIVTNISSGEQTPIQSAIAVSRLALVALDVLTASGLLGQCQRMQPAQNVRGVL